MRRHAQRAKSTTSRALFAGLLAAVLALPALAADVPASSQVTSSSDPVHARLAKRAAKARGKRPSVQKPPPTPTTPSAPAPDDDEGGGGVAPTDRRTGPSRIEFDDRLIQGQTNKANAIYLFERRASELRTLVKKRQHFHEEIDESLD